MTPHSPEKKKEKVLKPETGGDFDILLEFKNSNNKKETARELTDRYYFQMTPFQLQECRKYLL